jgi:SnoaL-like domain
VSEVSGVADVIARFVLAIDDRDWPTVTRYLADRVRRDYSSLTAAPPDEIAGPDLVAEWREVLSGLDTHQHVLGLPVIDVPDDDGREAARAAVHVVATHTLNGDPGSPWIVGGTYRFRLRRVGDRWRISAITLDTRWETGERALLDRAAARRTTAAG